MSKKTKISSLNFNIEVFKDSVFEDVIQTQIENFVINACMCEEDINLANLTEGTLSLVAESVERNHRSLLQHTEPNFSLSDFQSDYYFETLCLLHETYNKNKEIINSIHALENIIDINSEWCGNCLICFVEHKPWEIKDGRNNG